MQIVELGENSMVIMKDSNDPHWKSVGNIYKRALRDHRRLIVRKDNPDKEGEYVWSPISSDYIYTAGRLIIFFSENLNDKFSLHDKVMLGYTGYTD